MSFSVYLLRCADQSYYVGHTDDLEKRITQHQRGEIAGYTTTRRPVRLVHAESFATREEALRAERQLKGWSRKKKEAWARGDWTEVSRLGQRHTPSRSPRPSG
jgi:predicted GIY-YIG superfamily endonuclease